MPFIKGKDRDKYDPHIDKLIALLRSNPADRAKVDSTYIIYRLLMETFLDDDIQGMFSILGVLEATKLNVCVYFNNVEQRIQARRWLNSDGAR